MRTRLHHFADAHGMTGKVEKEHVILAVAYGVAAFGHWEVVVATAYLVACILTFITHKEG